MTSNMRSTGLGGEERITIISNFTRRPLWTCDGYIAYIMLTQLWQQIKAKKNYSSAFSSPKNGPQLTLHFRNKNYYGQANGDHFWENNIYNNNASHAIRHRKLKGINLFCLMLNKHFKLKRHESSRLKFLTQYLKKLTN